jgi:hypothetical protein
VPETVASAAILAFGFLLIMRRRSA